jgi:hypothetical protein
MNSPTPPLAELQAQFDREMRINITYPEARKETIAVPGGGVVVRFLRDPGMSFISYAQASPRALDALIEAQTVELRAHGRPFEWLTCEHDHPAVQARLEAYGYTCEEPAPILVLDLREAPEQLTQPPRADVRRLSGAEGLETIIGVMQRVYGGSFDWMRGRMGQHLTIPGYLSLWAAFVDQAPASAGWIYFYPDSAFAGIWGGSTVAERRGNGLYTALLAARTREAIARGRRYLFISASEMSRPIVERLGFKLLTVEYSWTL